MVPWSSEPFPSYQRLDTAAPQKLHFRVEPKTNLSVFPQIYKDVYIYTQTREYVLYSVFTYNYQVTSWYCKKTGKFFYMNS